MPYIPTIDNRLIALIDAISSTKPVHASEIRERLFNDPRVDHVPCQRTIERDLEKIAAEYPLTCVIRQRKKLWRWDGESLRDQAVHMSAEHAFALLVLRDKLDNQLPPAVSAAMQPYFRRAEKVIARSHLQRLLVSLRAGNDACTNGEPSRQSVA